MHKCAHCWLPGAQQGRALQGSDSCWSKGERTSECIVVFWHVRVLFSLADLISSICGNKTDLSQRSTCLNLSLSDFILQMLISSFNIPLIIAPTCILEHFRTNSCSSVQRSPKAVGLFQPTNPTAAVAADAQYHPVSLQGMEQFKNIPTAPWRHKIGSSSPSISPPVLLSVA